MASGAIGGAAVAGVARGAAAGAAGVEPEAGGGEDRCTRGRKALPPRVFTILEPEKEKKGGGGASENGIGMGNEKERKKRALYRRGVG